MISRLMRSMAAIWCVSASAFAQHDHADIFVGRPELGTRTQIGAAFVPEQLDTTTRIFEADLGVDVLGGINNVYFATEPGFFNAGSMNLLGASNPAGALPLLPGESISLNTVPLTLNSQTASLFYWNGFGEVSFAPSPAVLSVEPVGANADSSGAIDDHPIFEIDDPLSHVLPAGGIYLVGLTAQLDGLRASDPVFLLLVTGEEFEAGVEAAEAYLAAVPEPSGGILAAVAATAIVLCRRGR